VRVGVLASGRGSNFDALLLSTREAGSPAEIVVVVSDRADAAVLEKARAASIPVEIIDPGTRRGPWTPEGIAATVARLHAHELDLICLAGFMRILPAEIVRAFPQAILNIHPSLLPAFPGTRPQRQALRAGVKVSGCTVHFVDEGVDTGPILLQRVVPVKPGDTEETLAARVLEQEHLAYPAAVRAVAEGRVEHEGRTTIVTDPLEPVS
jgi:phosphoribosylglycinamide formyltransferase-1